MTSNKSEPELELDAIENPAASGDWREDPALDQFWQVMKRLPKYARVTYNLARDEDAPRVSKATLVAGGAYLISPIDLIPGIIPVLGQLDDVLVLLLTLRSALENCPPTLAEAHLRKVGLEPGQLDEDLAAARAVAVWIGQRGLNRSRQAARQTYRMAQSVSKHLPWQSQRATVASEIARRVEQYR